MAQRHYGGLVCLAITGLLACTPHRPPHECSAHGVSKGDDPPRVVEMEALPRPEEVVLSLSTREREVAVFRRANALRFMVSGETHSLSEREFARQYPHLYRHYEDSLARSERASLLAI